MSIKLYLPGEVGCILNKGRCIFFMQTRNRPMARFGHTDR